MTNIGILFIVASTLYNSYHALGWWSVCMYYQQNKVKNTIQLVKKKYQNILVVGLLEELELLQCIS